MSRHLTTLTLVVLLAVVAAMDRAAAGAVALARSRAQALGAEPERGDVPGWVMVTLMSAGLVAVIWVLADDWLRQLFQQAVDRVTGP